uniref:DUF7054 domain-containing protein n=1 Tax=Opuntia streptacantha TaxID=393608 RepID=A0A7C9EUD6_OPUST
MPYGRTAHRLRRRAPPSGGLNLSETVRRSRPIEVLPKCPSEPLIFPATEDAGDSRSSDSGDGYGGWFGRMHTWNDVIFPAEISDASSPLNRRRTNSGYEKDAKVVITVTVEGSPGPIRALVKLGASVEDMIKLVIKKYEEEGRTPRLDHHTPSSFDLHLSYFSLQSLDRTDAIGEVGSRSFYLRKGKMKSHEESATATPISSLSNSEIVLLPGISPKHSGQLSPSMGVLPWIFTRKMNKFVRRMHKLFKLFGCLHCR